MCCVTAEVFQVSPMADQSSMSMHVPDSPLPQAVVETSWDWVRDKLLRVFV